MEYPDLTSELQSPSDELAQRALARWNARRLMPCLPEEHDAASVDHDRSMLEIEGRYIDELRATVAGAAAAAPLQPALFVRWFENLAVDGPGQHDPLFEWLAEEADREQISWFLLQESTGEMGFEDLLAFTQVRMPTQAKLELARNYWDEMGRGQPKGMHGPMFELVIETLGITPDIDRTVWQSLALANAVTALATTRRFSWHAIGALGVNELIAPERSALVARALRRIGLSDRERRYFDLHAALEVKHSADYNREVLLPLVAEDPRRASAIAEGALIRLTCNARCSEEYRRRLWN